ncbi:MAG: MSP porin [Treponemataceae bacterium]
MKKFLSILLCISMLGSFVFAQDGLAVKAKGSATLTWGIDLGKGTKKDFGEPAYPTHGFYNDHNLKISIPFFADKQSFKGGGNKEADVYADVQFYVRPEAKGSVDGFDVDARLVFFGAYLTVYSEPYFGTDYARGWKSITDAKTSWFEPKFDGWGTKIGYANPDVMDIDVGLKFGSNRNWKRGDDVKYPDGKTNKDRPEEDTESLYAIGFDFHMEPVEKYLTIDATVNSTFQEPKRYMAGEPMGGGKEGKSPHTNFGLKLGSKPVDGLTIGLGFDGVTGLVHEDKEGKKSDAFGWDLGFNVGYRWVDFGLYVAGADTDHDGINKDSVTAADLAMHIGFDKKESDATFAEGLGLHATLNVYEMLTHISDIEKELGVKVPLGMNIGASYKANITDSMWIRPFFDVWGETNHKEYEDGTALADRKAYFGLAYELGLTFSPVEKTEITAKWAHGKTKKAYEGGSMGDNYMIDAPAQHNCHNGTFTLGCKLIF